MEYFYDRETDKLSILLGDFDCYAGSEEVAPGVILHVDARRRPLGIEISEAKAIVGVKGLTSFEARPMTSDELADRMQGTINGRVVLRALLQG